MSTTNEEMKAEGIEAQVCADIARRQQLGLSKYGTTVANNPLELRAWLQHAYEEMLDAAVYLRRAMAELDGKAKKGAGLQAAQPCLHDVGFYQFEGDTFCRQCGADDKQD